MSIDVSIIIPVYNANEFLRETVGRIRKQTLKNIEIILVDDGSTDGSSKTCDEIAADDKRVKVIHQKNAGVCAARNNGIAVAKGEYVGFSDADDIPYENLYETLYALAVKNNCDMSMVNYATVFEDGKVINNTGCGQEKIYRDKNELLIDFFSWKIYSGIYTKLFSRKLCSMISFEEGKKINEDRMYIFDALRNASLCCHKDVVCYQYIRREGSSSNVRFSEKQFDSIYFANKMLQATLTDFPELKNYAEANLINAYLKVLQLICLTDGYEEYINTFNEYVEFLRKYKFHFCRKYLGKNSFIKWLCLKTNKQLFRKIVLKFAHT